MTASEIVPPNTTDLAELAVWEVESIAGVLQRHFQQAKGEDLFVLGLAIRLEQLAGVVLSALSGEQTELEHARATLIGPAAVRAAAEPA